MSVDSSGLTKLPRGFSNLWVKMGICSGLTEYLSINR